LTAGQTKLLLHRDDFPPPSYLTDFSHFLSDKNILKIAGHGQNISKKGPVESADGISYFDFQLFYFL
jgi:hypothetical protein